MPATPRTPADLLRLQVDPLSVDEALAHIASPRAGGSCVFVGTVRDHAGGVQGVTHIEYEAYTEAAEGAMARVAGRVRADVPAVVRVAILHRYGHLFVGDASVIVAAAAAHRADAFAACRLGIDLVKQMVPVWKKEHWADGSSAWVACHDELLGAPPAEPDAGDPGPARSTVPA